MLRGIRGAIQVKSNTRAAIAAGTQELLRHLILRNRLRLTAVAAAFFTVTRDLDADFPAFAARQIGWTDVPLLCASEIPVRGAMPRVVRVLLLVNTTRRQSAMWHGYLGAAGRLRPDRSPGIRASGRA
ncbi:MAG: chorismate mutase [Planctomycetes bacterium]|nr:chorismate mutase [Planctomycetota bacterium]